MFTLTIKELAARKLRLLTTAFAVLLGVAFMAGTLVFTDTIRATYDTALAEANAGVDAYVRTPSEFDLGYGEPGPRLDASLAETVGAVEGVDDVALRINGYAQVVGPDGTPVGDVSQAPAFGTNWTTIDELNPYELASGHAPVGDDQIVIDKASAEEAGYAPGDVVTVLTKREPRQFTIAGIATFAGADSPAGATAVLFTDAAATELLAEPGQADAIAVTAEPGTSQDELAARIDAAIGGDDVEVLTGSRLIRQEQESLRNDMAPMATIFVVFAFVAVLVGAFIINNTFSITVAQRTREMAMLRAIGASGRQVMRSVLLEAMVIGALASGAGLVSGIGVAAGLRQLMSVLGFDMPDHPTVINSTAMVSSFALGVIVTVLSAWLPARRAARIAPIAALLEVNVDRSAGSVRRAVVGSMITAGGVAALVTAHGELNMVGLGAVGLLGGVAVLAPVLARPVAAVFGVPLRMLGLRGELATRNAARNPKRTARTAASLMIGVALVGFMTVFAASAKSSLSNSLDTDFAGTHIVHGGGDSMSGFSPDLADELRSTPGVDVVTQSRITPAIIDDKPTMTFSGFDATTVDEMFRLGAVEGNLDSLGADGIAVSAEKAEENGWSIGTVVPVTFPGGETTLTVEAIYTAGTDWVGSMFADLDALRANGANELDVSVFVAGDEAAITSVAAGYGSADVLDKDGFLDVVSEEIDTMLMMFYALLMLAVVIALLGIANTLALSIFERTKELGLLRAVGMGRSQIRSAIRWESIIIAVFGTTLGLAIGVVFGWAIVRVVEADGLVDTLTIPAGNLAVVTVIAALAGAVAAVVPARRAARHDVLKALATE